jgi:AbiV family abortive infection protein
MRQPPPSQGVTKQYLLEGAVYALEQGGLLLHDSVLLYQKGKYASAIVMALFAREEVGRYKLLRDLRKEMMGNGRTVTVDDIRRKCKNHLEKQFRGQFGVTIKPSGNDKMSKLMKTMIRSHPQSPEAHKANAELDIMAEQLLKKLPYQRHDLRQKSLYVEPSDSGTSWNRPKDQSKQTAREEIQGAAMVYSGAIDRFTRVDAYRDEYPTFYSALEAWKECPTMPNRADPPSFD